MNIKTHIVNRKKIAEIESNEILIRNADDSLDLLGNIYYQGFESLILYRRQISPEFFHLQNGMAGTILQKFSNYRIPLAIVGDFGDLPGNSIHQFISESNKTGNINFIPTLHEALHKLSLC